MILNNSSRYGSIKVKMILIRHRWINRSTFFLVKLATFGLISLASFACGLIPNISPTPVQDTPKPPLGIPIPPTFDVSGLHQLTDDDFYYEDPIWSPDGRTLAIARNRMNMIPTGPDFSGMEIILMDVSTGETKLIDLGNGSVNIDPTWSPDGTQLAFMSKFPVQDNSGNENSPYRLIIYSIANKTWMDYECKTCGWPFWLQDGSILVMVNLSTGPSSEAEFGLVRIDPKTGAMVVEEQIVGIVGGRTISSLGEGVVLGPYFLSPDNNEIMMEANYNCDGLWMYEIGKGEPPYPFIDSPDVQECDPSWSWDGSKIAYTVMPQSSLGPRDLIIANADDSDPVTLIKGTGSYYFIRDLAWSPDGSQIAFVYGIIDFTLSKPSFSDVYIVNVPPELQPKSGGGED
jgi:Tol biopolymer transport system component